MIKRTVRKMRPGAGGGTLLTLSILFLLSGALRFWDTAGAAIATAASQESLPEMTTECACDTPPSLAAALEATRVREEQLELRELALTDRMRALEVAERTVSDKLDELREAEERLRGTMALSQSAAENDLARLTSVYENMKSKDAAPLFAQMAPEFAAGFLGRMRADAAAEILAGLDPELAYSISVLLASRNAAAPVE